MKKNSTFIAFLYIVVLIYMLFQLNSACEPYIGELICLFMSYLLIGAIYCINDLNYKIDIFEPFFLCTVIMTAIFIVMPIIDICNGDTLAFGIDVMPYCLKGTLIFDISYIALVVAYFRRPITLGFRRRKIYKDKEELSEKTAAVASVLAIVIFIISYGFSVIDQTTHGFNLQYILTFGNAEITTGEVIGQNLSFLGLFANTLLTCWLIYLVCGKSRGIKIVMLILTLAMYFIRTSRHILIDLIVAPIILYYVFRKKRPPLYLVTILLLAVVLASGLIGFARGAIRNGWDIELDGFGLDYVVENAKFNLQIYKSYYGVLRAIPEKMDYTLGLQILYTVIMIVPRIVWPNKPSSYQAAVIGTGLNEYAVKTGFAFPNLGEFYGEFGIIGGIVGYFIFGAILNHWKSMYASNHSTKVSTIKYSILLPVCLQLIIRGAIYQNFYLVVFLMLPFWCIDITCLVLKCGRFK